MTSLKTFIVIYILLQGLVKRPTLRGIKSSAHESQSQNQLCVARMEMAPSFPQGITSYRNTTWKTECNENTPFANSCTSLGNLYPRSLSPSLAITSRIAHNCVTRSSDRTTCRPFLIWALFFDLRILICIDWHRKSVANCPIPDAVRLSLHSKKMLRPHFITDYIRLLLVRKRLAITDFHATWRGSSGFCRRHASAHWRTQTPVHKVTDPRVKGHW